MTYQDFKNEWNGRRIDYDHVYGFQCVDLILEFLKECAGVATGVWGNAIDYANNPTPTFLNAVTRVTDGSKTPGDIIVLRGLSGNPYGHIALRDSDLDKMFEQNAATGGGTGTGRDAVGVYRNIPTDRVAAIYRLKAFQNTTPAPLASNSASVFLPASAGPWHLYNYGSSYNPNDSRAVKGILRPDLFGGLTYKIVSWVGDYAVVIDTQNFGRGVIWIKGTSAVIK